MLALQYLFNISVKYILKYQNENIFIIFIQRSVAKCPRLSLYVPWKLRKWKNKIVYSFSGHPVADKSYRISIHNYTCLTRFMNLMLQPNQFKVQSSRLNVEQSLVQLNRIVIFTFQFLFTLFLQICKSANQQINRNSHILQF